LNSIPIDLLSVQPSWDPSFSPLRHPPPGIKRDFPRVAWILCEGPHFVAASCPLGSPINCLFPPISRLVNSLSSPQVPLPVFHFEGSLFLFVLSKARVLEITFQSRSYALLWSFSFATREFFSSFMRRCCPPPLATFFAILGYYPSLVIRPFRCLPFFMRSVDP